jgi:hypothetical protein
MNKKSLTIALFISILILLFPIIAHADSPAPPLSVNISVTNAPDTVAYYDLLVPANMPWMKAGKINLKFMALHPEMAGSQLANYNDSGFISYTMYFQADDILNSNPDFPKILHHDAQTYNSRSFPAYDSVSFPETRYNAVSQFMIAAVDSNGNILKISPMYNTDKIRIGMITGFTFDYQQNTVQANTTGEFGFYLALFLLGGFRIGYSVLIEMLIAVPFKIRPLSLVAILNVFSEIVLTAGMFIFSIFGISYVQSLILFEALVLLIEFLGFIKFTKNISKGRITLYVFAANAASLAFGLWLNTYHLNFN